MAAPVRADIRMSRLETPKTYWATNHAVTADDRRHAEGSQNVYDTIVHPETRQE